MVCSLVREENRHLLEEISRRTELESIVFIDSILPLLGNKKYISEINTHLTNKDYLSASLTAIKGLAEEVSLSKIKSAIIKNG